MNNNLPKVGQSGKALNLKVPKFKVPKFYKAKNPLPKVGVTPADPVKPFNLNNFMNKTTLRKRSSSQSGGALRGPNVPVSQKMSITEAKELLNKYFEIQRQRADEHRKNMKKLKMVLKYRPRRGPNKSRKVNSAPVVRPKSAGPNKSKVSSRKAKSSPTKRPQAGELTRGMLVRKVMSEKGMSLPDASSYISRNGLYLRKSK